MKLFQNKYPILILLFFPLVIKCGTSDKDVLKEIPVTGFVDSVYTVRAGNPDSSPQEKIAAGKDSTLYIYKIENGIAEEVYKTRFNSNVMLIRFGNIDGDEFDEVIVATGKRRYADAEASVHIIDNISGKFTKSTIYSLKSPRPQPTYLNTVDINSNGTNEIIFSCFNSKYNIETIALERTETGWKINRYPVERMAMARDAGVLDGSGKNVMVVGRIYGDSLGLPGDMYIFSDEKKVLPSYRGVRSVKIGDANNDGTNEIYVGDGWHYDYGKVARGRISFVKCDETKCEYSLIEDVKYQYVTSQIEICDINGDGKNELLTRGNRFFRIYKFKYNKWGVFNTNIKPGQFTYGDITGDGHLELVFAGPALKIYQVSGNIPLDFNPGREVKTEKINPVSLINKPAPEIRMKKWFGKSYGSIKELEGKVVVLDFWATWCNPCIKMFPFVRQWHEKYNKDGLVILGITRFDGRQDINKISEFVKKENFPYPVGISEESFTHLNYGVGTIPHIVLIGRKGLIRYFRTSSGNTDEIEEEIKKLLY